MLVKIDDQATLNALRDFMQERGVVLRQCGAGFYRVGEDPDHTHDATHALIESAALVAHDAITTNLTLAADEGLRLRLNRQDQPRQCECEYVDVTTGRQISVLVFAGPVRQEHTHVQ